MIMILTINLFKFLQFQKKTQITASEKTYMAFIK